MFTLRQPKSGLPVEDISRKVAICQAVFFRCKIKMVPLALKRLNVSNLSAKLRSSTFSLPKDFLKTDDKQDLPIHHPYLFSS